MVSDKVIHIVVNGLKEKVPEGSSISSLIVRFDELDAHLIVEHNGRFVYPQKYGSTIVSENDTLEFVNPDFGG
jgi:thiamine biosynthesis protein ThiS